MLGFLPRIKEGYPSARDLRRKAGNQSTQGIEIAFVWSRPDIRRIRIVETHRI